MDDNEIYATCQKCGTELTPSDKQCPSCGHTGKAFKRTASVSLKISVISTRVRHGRIGFKKFMKEMLSRWRPSGDPRLKNGIREERTIDKEKNEYHQICTDAKTGEITHEEHESLTNHKK